LNNKNQIINNLQNELNNLKISYNNSQSLIKQLQNKLNQKEKELSQLKDKLLSNLLSNTNQIKNDSDNKNSFAITFRANNQDFIYPIICNKNQSISRLEEELYNEYPKYKDLNTYLMCNGAVLKRFKTVGENNIKKGDAIVVHIFE